MTEKQTITDEMTSVLEEIIEEPAKQPQKGELVTLLNDEELMIGNRQYKLVMDYREGFNPEKLGERYSEVLARYDYIVGDWGYEQLRLKGFLKKITAKHYLISASTCWKTICMSIATSVVPIS